MINSIEAAVLHSVLEGHEERAAERLHEHFRDWELIGFRTNVANLLSLVDSEIESRGAVLGIRAHRGMTADEAKEAERLARLAMAADTGEINIIRGRE